MKWVVLLLGVPFCFAVLLALSCVWAQTAEEWVAGGEPAYKAKDYQKAVEFYTTASEIEEATKRAQMAEAKRQAVAKGDITCQEMIKTARMILDSRLSIARMLALLAQEIGEPYTSCESMEGTTYCWKCKKRDGKMGALNVHKHYSTQELSSTGEFCPCR